MTVKNKEKFEKFLDENRKEGYYNFEAYLEEIKNQVYTNVPFERSLERYELSKFESKDKRPHDFYFWVTPDDEDYIVEF